MISSADKSMVVLSELRVNPFPAKFIYSNFHPHEVVAGGSQTQLHVGENVAENYFYLFN